MKSVQWPIVEVNININIIYIYYFKEYIIYPIGSMYGIHANIWDILMGSMLAYIPAPWILWVLYNWLLVSNMFLFFHTLGIVIPTD